MAAAFAVLALLSVVLLTEAGSSAASNGGKKTGSCADFSRDVILGENTANGTWYPVQCWHGGVNGCGNRHCLALEHVDEKERKELSERMSAHLPGMNWAALELKMSVPCDTAAHSVYFLERKSPNGSFQTLPVPAPTAKLETSEIHRSPMNLKLFKDHLVMMDCQDHFTFVMAREPPQSDSKLDPELIKLVAPFTD